MKKLVLFSVLLLLLNAACEDPLEGNIAPYSTNIDDWKAITPSEPDYTHWVFSFSTEGKPDNTYTLDPNHDIGSEVYVEVVNGVITNAWITSYNKFSVSTQSQTQTNKQLDLINPSDPLPGQPHRVVLGEIISDDSYCYSWFSASERSSEIENMIMVSQPKWELGFSTRNTPKSTRNVKTISRRATSDRCTPTSGEAFVYVPISS
jgi:hypothetical protein